MNSFSRDVQEYVASSYHSGDFKLVWEDFVADIYVSEAENAVVLHCAKDFAAGKKAVADKMWENSKKIFCKKYP